MRACQQWISYHISTEPILCVAQKLVSFKMFPNLVANYALHYFRDDRKKRYDLQLDGSRLFPFLGTATTWAVFHSEGMDLLFNDIWNNFERKCASSGAQLLSTVAEMPFGPVALDVSRLRNFVRTTLGQYLMVEMVSQVLTSAWKEFCLDHQDEHLQRRCCSRAQLCLQHH